jgi:hypothetical protein
MTARFPQPFARPRPLISVWPTGQLDSHAQLAEGRYMPETAQDSGRMPPAVAAHAITTYTRPGDTVLDPDCGSGTVLVEALRTGRHAIGVTDRRRWWTLSRANSAAVERDDGLTNLLLLRGHSEADDSRSAGLAGRVHLLMSNLRPGGIGWVGPPIRRDAEREPADEVFAHVRAILLRCRPWLRPGAFVIFTVRPRRRHGYLLDLTSPILDAGQAAGFVAIDRCIALLAELRDDRLNMHASHAQRRSVRRHGRITGHPTALTTHHEVVVFSNAAEAAQVAARSAPIPLPASPAALLMRRNPLEGLGTGPDNHVALQRGAA